MNNREFKLMLERMQAEIDRLKRQLNRQGKHPVGPVGLLLGKTTVSHLVGETEDVELFRGSTEGSETTTDKMVPTYNRLGDLDDESWVYIGRVNGKWEVINAPCGEEE